jgi:signal transduction histidine kinase
VLKAIQEAAADAARELRSTLGVLRTADDCDGSGLGQLDRLVARTRAAGQPVSVTLSGPVSDMVRELPPEVDQAAYRIVQEALTNVGRHASGAGAAVRLTHGADLLTVEVDDDGGDGATVRPALDEGLASGPGLGLVGMRERVSALGGRFAAGPRAAGGFRVCAEFPLRPVND